MDANHLKPHEQRLLLEYDALKARVEKIAQFLSKHDATGEPNLSPREKSLMRVQSSMMQDYLDVLGERLPIPKEEVPEAVSNLLPSVSVIGNQVSIQMGTRHFALAHESGK